MIVTERMRRFVDAYIKLANATKAAIEAGYSPKSAHVTGCNLLKHPKILAYLESKRVKREVHADVTFQNLMALANVALSDVSAAHNDGLASVKEKAMAVNAARACLETLGKAEGLFIERVQLTGEVRMTLQQLVTKAAEYKAPELIIDAPVPRLVDSVFKSKGSLSPAAGGVEVQDSTPPPPPKPEAKAS